MTSLADLCKSCDPTKNFSRAVEKLLNANHDPSNPRYQECLDRLMERAYAKSAQHHAAAAQMLKLARLLYARRVVRRRIGSGKPYV